MLKRILPQEEITILLFDLLEKIEERDFSFDRVCGIARGGIPASKFLAEAFQLPHDQIRISFYNDDIYLPWQPEIELNSFNLKKTERVLFVDDIVYRGSTMGYISKLFPGFERGKNWQFASIFWNRTKSPHNPPDVCARTIDTDDWVVFPWELEEDYEKTEKDSK